MCRAYAAAIWLPDGRIYVIGGRHDSMLDEWSCSVEFYTRQWNAANPIQVGWTESTPMPIPVISPSAVRFKEMILVVGDKSAALFSPADEFLDGDLGQWTVLSCPYELTFIFGQDDRIFAIGIHNFRFNYFYLCF